MLKIARILFTCKERTVAVIACMAMSAMAHGQTAVLPLQDLTSFQNPGKSWQIAGNVSADLSDENEFNVGKGTGVLVNMPSRRNKGQDLLTTFEHGDVDLELDFMMAKGSNSGIYLQGRYEVQLLDAWGSTHRSAASLGGIYERWDESRPEGQKGYQGYAPRQNVGRAPGLWQHLKISFQAPRFDASGKKTENARIMRIELNGVIIQEDVELFGPTRGSISNEEKATGPLRFQGDHGAVAFRNIKVNQYSKPRPELKNLTYKIYQGRYEKQPQYDSIPPEAEGPQGTSNILTSNLEAGTKQYLIRYNGTLVVKEPGEYTFNILARGGSGSIKVNSQDVVPYRSWEGKGTVTLPAGEVPFELLYSKYMDWERPVLALRVSGPGVREFLISERDLSPDVEADPIIVSAQERPVLRSFMDLPGQYRVTHAASVGSPNQLHYTYDLDHGTLIQLWRGDFLDATPMWHERGDGSSRPLGSVQRFGKPTITLATLASDQAAWATDTTGTTFIPKGYSLDQNSEPTFRYQIYGATVQDAIRVIENGKGLQRELNIQNPASGLYARVVEAEKIEDAGKGMYLINDKAYYLRLDDLAGAKPIIRTVSGRQELIVPVRSKLTYTILY
ncbi:family 16 glycoside hydrolase [Rufibacter roseus]|uniref:Family 16 glycoside hydrolase n=1 Tax=Rufibacter roseus TaxID=1567108 RepID=A0ABW2DKK7_9BACT|nr:family 16 glycoside hydrolase [Rufibacter roseus]